MPDNTTELPPPMYPEVRVPRANAVQYAKHIAASVHDVKGVRVDEFDNGYAITFRTADGTTLRVDTFGTTLDALLDAVVERSYVS